MPELTMDAPAFEGIGSRRNYGWMTAWIQDPKARRAVAHMPKLPHGATAREDAGAMAAFLASLKTEGDKPGIEPKAEQSDDGKALFDSLHCAACHNGPDATEADEKKIDLKQVREKFAPGMLAGFLLKPEAQFVWTRMPNFKLSEDQANQLAAYLNSTADKPKETAGPADGAVIEKGRKLVQTSGCLNCHSLKLENQFSAKPLAELAAQRWQQGCMAALHDEKGKAPEFGFTAEEREALQAFAATDRGSLTRSAPAEFAERQTRLLNCRECHGKVEGVPAFDILGGKLRPEWSKAFIAGEISYKPRPWLEARMPAFANRAALLAEGLAMQHGYPPQTPAEPAVDMEAAKLGQKLISAVGGFSCVSCHKVGDAGATQVFETAGINFAHTGERLMQPYFERWTRYPQLIDPATKMPTYFDEHGKSQLTTILDGDGAKQINALWQYVRLGSKMPPPPTQ
jgi:mono/diheme cytochrome c family protein